MDFLHRTWAEINLDALVHNFNIVKKSAPDSLIMAVVKADAYGHSAKDVALTLETAGADRFAVSNIEEAAALRNCGVTKPILILGYTPPKLAYKLCELDIAQALFSPEYAYHLSEAATLSGVTVKVHIKLDTGMGRIGFNIRTDDLAGINDAIKAAKLPGFTVEGVFTHFAGADSLDAADTDYTNKQYTRFCRAVELINKSGIDTGICHCCNSAGTALYTKNHLNMCRPGITLYGLAPAAGLNIEHDLVPVMTVKSVVSMVKTVNKGEPISYGRTFVPQCDMRVATVTAGYADGYPRALSSKGQVLIHGKRANIIGRICMDQLMIDVTNIPETAEGDEVVLFGKGLPVEELAELCGTINYEIICGISPRVPRIMKKNKGV